MLDECVMSSPRFKTNKAKKRWKSDSNVSSDLAVHLVGLSDDLYPAQHVLPVLCLQQVLAEVLGGQPQGMLALGLAVRDVHQAAPDVDRLLVLCRAFNRGAAKKRLPLVLVEEQRMGVENGVHPLPRPYPTSDFL